MDQIIETDLEMLKIITHAKDDEYKIMASTMPTRNIMKEEKISTG